MKLTSQETRLAAWLPPVLLTEEQPQVVTNLNFVGCDPKLELYPITVIVPFITGRLVVEGNGECYYSGEVLTLQTIIMVPKRTLIGIKWYDFEK